MLLSYRHNIVELMSIIIINVNVSRDIVSTGIIYLPYFLKW